MRADPDCPVCGESPTITALVDYEEFCGTGGATVLASTDVESTTSAARTASFTEVSVTELDEMLAARDAGETAVRARRRARAG